LLSESREHRLTRLTEHLDLDCGVERLGIGSSRAIGDDRRVGLHRGGIRVNLDNRHLVARFIHELLAELGYFSISTRMNGAGTGSWRRRRRVVPSKTIIAVAVAERFLALRATPVDRRQLERVLREYVAHHNLRRPHRALQQQPPVPKPVAITTLHGEGRVHRRERLGGLLHEYELAA
jgi:transposase InsO family protein